MLNGVVNLTKGTSLTVEEEGTLTFGDGIHVGPNTIFNVRNKTTISDKTAISYDCYISDNDSHNIYDADTRTRTNADKEIYIGKHNWICCRTVILKGVHTADDVCIGCQSRVTKDLPEGNAVYVDNRCVRRNIVFDFVDCTAIMHHEGEIA